ncbi:hypothetical protein [Amycolatopsis sp. NPDC051061]|uniref:hypothetical protein n=1 Tax=Amycolatopsis sp. NPDC051061 TaxID=3155042 RepID=UPI00342052E9
MAARAPSTQTVVGPRSRDPTAEITASRPSTAAVSLSCSCRPATTTCAGSFSRAGSRTTLGATLAELTADPGRAPLRDNLVRVARLGLAFYTDSFPIAVSMFSSRELLRSHRDRVDGAGPRIPLKGVEGYLCAEVALGRLKAGTDVEAVASLLLGACFQQAFLASFEEARPSEVDELGARLADTLLAGL